MHQPQHCKCSSKAPGRTPPISQPPQAYAGFCTVGIFIPSAKHSGFLGSASSSRRLTFTSSPQSSQLTRGQLTFWPCPACSLRHARYHRIEASQRNANTGAAGHYVAQMQGFQGETFLLSHFLKQFLL